MDVASLWRGLTRPTDAQYREFARHVANAHSWYKHLPLLTGGEFVVFVAPDAGIGRRLAAISGTDCRLVLPPEGPEFTEAHPRIHYSWKTTSEYRRRFGYLDYGYRLDGRDRFARDVDGGAWEIPGDLLDLCGFTLYPYVNGDPDAIRWAHEDAVKRLRNGEPHPRRELVLEWARLTEQRDAAWSRLDPADQELALALEGPADGPAVPRDGTPSAVSHYLAMESRLCDLHRTLGDEEEAKIRRALERLDGWLAGPPGSPGA